AHDRALDPHPSRGHRHLPEGADHRAGEGGRLRYSGQPAARARRRRDRRRPDRPGAVARRDLPQAHFRLSARAPMKNALAIAKKELNIYFATPIAYVMFTLFVVIGSYFFLRLLAAYGQASLMYMRFNSPEMMNRLNFQDAIFRALFGNLGVILIFVVPFLTMRLVAEEKKQKTIELLYSTPVTPGQIVWGKYLAALAILVCTLTFTLLYPALVQIVAKDPNGVEWRSIFLGYAGLFLLGAAYMALGLFVSSLTESQVVAALITFVVLLMTWIIGWTAA